MTRSFRGNGRTAVRSVASALGTFSVPGRYLVICNFLPHFVDNDMYGWVIVQ